MTVQHTFTCDGCGNTETKPVNSPIVYPQGWSCVAVTIAGMVGETNNGQSSFDLCGSCQHTLDQYLNPTSWPRPVRDARAR